MSKAAANHLTWHAMTADLGLMSIKQVSAQVQHHILLGLCAYADHEGIAYPAQVTLVKALGVSRTSVHYGLVELEKLGHIKALGTGKKSGLVTRWQVFPEVFATQKARRYEQAPAGQDAGLVVGQPAGQPAGLVAGLAQQDYDPNISLEMEQTQVDYGSNGNTLPYKHNAEVEVQVQAQAHLHASQQTTEKGGLLERQKAEQTALVERSLALDLSTHPPLRPAGDKLKAVMRADYCTRLEAMPQWMSNDQKVSLAVAQRNGETINPVLYQPPQTTADYVEPTPEELEKIKKIQADMKALFSKRV